MKYHTGMVLAAVCHAGSAVQAEDFRGFNLKLLGYTSRLADPAVVDDLIANRQNGQHLNRHRGRD